MKYTKLFLLMFVFLTSCVAPATPEPTQTLTPTVTPTATQTSIPTPTITPAPTQVGGGSGRLIFTYSKDEFLDAFPDLKGETNVFIANIDGTNLTAITNGWESFNDLRAVSPDGTKILIQSSSPHKDAILFLVDLNSLNSEPIKLAYGLSKDFSRNDRGNQYSTAKWINESQIAYIGQGEAGLGVYKINIDGTNPINIYKYNQDGDGGEPFQIVAIDDTRIYWDTLEWETPEGDPYLRSYFWWSSLEGGERTPLEFDGKQIFSEGWEAGLSFSPDGAKIAWGEWATPESGPPYHTYLHIASISDINNPYTIETLGGTLILKWFPDGSKILVFDDSASFESMEEIIKYYEEHPEESIEGSITDLYGVYEVPTSPDLPIRNYNLAADVMGSYTFDTIMDIYDISPDGRQIILAIYKENADGNVERKLNFLDLETITLSEASGFTFSNTAIGGVHWIP